MNIQNQSTFIIYRFFLHISNFLKWYIGFISFLNRLCIHFLMPLLAISKCICILKCSIYNCLGGINRTKPLIHCRVQYLKTVYLIKMYVFFILMDFNMCVVLNLNYKVKLKNLYVSFISKTFICKDVFLSHRIQN